jgi:hypothetical protein
MPTELSRPTQTLGKVDNDVLLVEFYTLKDFKDTPEDGARLAPKHVG